MRIESNRRFPSAYVVIPNVTKWPLEAAHATPDRAFGVVSPKYPEKSVHSPGCGNLKSFRRRSPRSNV
jgi:hypothetical protein